MMGAESRLRAVHISSSPNDNGYLVGYKRISARSEKSEKSIEREASMDNRLFDLEPHSSDGLLGHRFIFQSEKDEKLPSPRRAIFAPKTAVWSSCQK
jgi:hypothetical protein